MFSIFGQWKTIFNQMHLLPDLPIKVCILIRNFAYDFSFWGRLPSLALSKFPAGQLTFQHQHHRLKIFP